MSERRKTTTSGERDARWETRQDRDVEGRDGPRSGNGVGGGSWLDRVRASASSPELVRPGLVPETGGTAQAPADQPELPWNRSATPASEPFVVAPERPDFETPPSPWQGTEAPTGSIPEQTPGPALESPVGLSVARLRSAALETARRDADAGLPALDSDGRSESEQELRGRCASLFRDWASRQRDRINGIVSDKEGRITETLGAAALDVDRFERITTELFRLKKRQEVNRTLVESTLSRAESEVEPEEPDVATDERGSRSFQTRWYALAIGFLGIVEFLANSPVFGALLPRDPLTEQQIRFVAETSEGWLAGATRVASNFILRPDAALLAAGVVTFLCVLAHFFGHSLRRLLIHTSSSRSGDTVGNRSAAEYVVPMILCGLGLTLVLGVLFQARVTLGDVAVQRFAQDSSKIEELRRNASWLRVDGNLVAANEQANRADDLEALAKEQREYAMSMSGLSFPIFLLNTTLVLVAISAAYFHMRDPRRERFNELPWEQQRRQLVDLGDAVQGRIAESQGRLVRLIGELKSLLTETPLKEAPALAHQLEATVVAYRAENGRLRGLDPREIPAFAEPVRLQLEVEKQAAPLMMRSPEEYDVERRALVERFEEIRTRFTREATTW
jgi:hypothetical protein